MRYREEPVQQISMNEEKLEKQVNLDRARKLLFFTGQDHPTGLHGLKNTVRGYEIDYITFKSLPDRKWIDKNVINGNIINRRNLQRKYLSWVSKMVGKSTIFKM